MINTNHMQSIQYLRPMRSIQLSQSFAIQLNKNSLWTHIIM